jgi:hypothetical protein
MNGHFSDTLIKAGIENAIALGEQVILFQK